MPAGSQPYALAIDLGTSGPKVGLVSPTGGIPGHAFRPVPLRRVPNGGAEHDPEDIWRAVVEATHAAMQAGSVSGNDVVAVICDSHFFSLVPLDRDGRPTMNMMVWLDKRPAAAGRGDSPWRQFQWLRIHGVPPLSSGVDNISKIRWIRDAHPDIYEQTALFLEPSDFLAHRLTGRATTNPCSIFPMQVTDNRDPDAVTYANTLLRYADLDRDQFPELLPVDGIVGEVLPGVADELGISHKARVITGMNDTQAGAMGCAAFRGNHAGIVLGSSGVLVSHAPKKKTDIRTGLFTLPSPVPGSYLMTGEGGVAGSALEHFLESLIFADDDFGALTPDDPYAQLEAVAAASPPGSNGVLFLPWMNGAHVPVSDGDMRGGFLNVSLGTRRVDLARAVFEGIAYQYRQLSDAARRFTGRPFDHYTLYGGGALSPTWSQTLADMLQTPVHRMAQPRLTNCLGLGLLAFQRLGRIGYDDIAAAVPIAEVLEPDPALRALYEDRCATMELAFRRNRRLFRKLNRPSGGSELTQPTDD